MSTSKLVEQLRMENIAFTPSPTGSDSDSEGVVWYPKPNRIRNRKPKNKTVKKSTAAKRKHNALTRIRKSVKKIGGKKSRKSKRSTSRK
jgi:hypothetical protein